MILLYKSIKKILAMMQYFSSLLESLILLAFYRHPNLRKAKKIRIFLTGPSLENDLKCIDFIDKPHIESLCVNSFCLNDFFLRIRPINYAVYDLAYFLDSEQHPWKDVANKLTQTVIWDMDLIVPAFAKRSSFIEIIKKNKKINIIYIKYNGFSKSNALTQSLFLITGQGPKIYNVLVWSILIGLWKNTSSIEIYGCDFSFFKQFKVGDDNLVYSGSRVFYQTSRLKGNYNPSMSEALRIASNAYEALYFLESISWKSGVKIKNMTKESCLDCFR